MAEPHDAVPSQEALVAATLALMTRWAELAAQGPAGQPCRHRSLLARKIVSNLFFLQHHPAASGPFRQIVANMHQSWQGMACAAQAGATAALPQAVADGRRLH